MIVMNERVAAIGGSTDTTVDPVAEAERALPPDDVHLRVQSRSCSVGKKSGRLGDDGDAALKAVSMAVYRTDSDGWIEFYNPASAELWGCGPPIESSRWCAAWRHYSVDGRPLQREESATAICHREGRRVRGIEAVIERPDGARISVLTAATPLRD